VFKVTLRDNKRLDIEMSGSLNSEEMRRALDELVNMSEGIVHGRMLYDVVDFHLPSLAAVAIEFSRLPSMFGFLTKFERAAVLTDKTWLQRVSEFEGRLFPGLEIKAFAREQREQAEAWLAGE
jgi:hypothetical protein